jgi:uncharacterized membrane protein YhfC
MASAPSPLFLLSGIGMMLVAVCAVLLWQRGKPSLWPATGIGAIAWVVGVSLKVAWAIPMNHHVHNGLTHLLGKAAGAPLFWLYIGALTGIFECLLAYLFVVRTRLKKADWNQAVAFGVGFGAIEALLLGLVSFLGLLAVIAFFQVIPPAQRATVAQAYGLGLALIPLPIVERITAILAHCFPCVLIVYGVRVGQLRWLGLSFAYKTLLDGFAAWALLSFGVKQSAAKMAQFEAMAGVFAVVALAGLWALKPRFIHPVEPASEPAL